MFGHYIESVSKAVVFKREANRSDSVRGISSYDCETSRLPRLKSFQPQLVITDVHKCPERETHLDLPDKEEFQRYYKNQRENLH
jgi:hypothetical protein